MVFWVILALYKIMLQALIERNLKVVLKLVYYMYIVTKHMATKLWIRNMWLKNFEHTIEIHIIIHNKGTWMDKGREALHRLQMTNLKKTRFNFPRCVNHDRCWNLFHDERVPTYMYQLFPVQVEQLISPQILQGLDNVLSDCLQVKILSLTVQNYVTYMYILHDTFSE